MKNPFCILLDREQEFEGIVLFRGSVAVAGALRGALIGEGEAVIADSAQVKGRLEADICRIDGNFSGDVVARERIQLGSGAQIDAQLQAPNLEIADGCRVSGRCEMIADD